MANDVSGTDAVQAPPAPAAALLRLLDCTMFWSPTGGGVRRYLQSKRAWIAAHPGWRHTLAVPGAMEPGELPIPGWPLPRSGGYRLPLRRGAAAAAMVRAAPDLIEAGDPYRLAWAALDAARQRGVPAVAYCHSNLPAMAAQWAGGNGRLATVARRTAERYLRHVYRGFDEVHAPSRAMTDTLLALGIAQARHQPLGVDTALFQPGLRDDGWRASLGLPAGSRVLLYAGRFAAEKNLPLLCDAVDLLGAPYWLVALGAGPQAPHGARVRVLPHECDDRAYARAVASADLFVHAGDQETFGLATLEAMAAGTPVLVRAAAGLAELASGGAGLAVHSAQPRDWADAIQAAFEAPAADTEARIAAARARALQHDSRVVLDALFLRYRMLVQAHAPHASGASARASTDSIAQPTTEPACLRAPSSS